MTEPAPRPAGGAAPLRFHGEAALFVDGADGVVERPGEPALVLPGQGERLARLSALAELPRAADDLRRALAADGGGDALVDELAALGVLVPWTLPDRLASLHHATTADRAREPAPPSAEVARALREAGGGRAVPLPPAAPPAAALADALARRRSVRELAGAPVPLERLSATLAAAAGCASAADGGPPAPLVPGAPPAWRPYPSPGALYPVEVLVHPLRVDGLEPAFYRYQPLSHRLARTAAAVPGPRLRWLFNEHPVDDAAFVVLLWADFKRASLGKYGEKAYRLLLLECGHLSQNLLLAAAAAGLGAVAVAGFRDAELAADAGLSYPLEAVLSTVVVGVPGAGGPPPDADA